LKRSLVEPSTTHQFIRPILPVKLTLLLTVLAIVAALALANSGSVSHTLRIEIQPTMMLEVGNTWETHSTSSTQSGGTLATASTTYGVTCIVENTLIQATLAAPFPEGTTVMLRMQTAIGTSLGWVELRQGLAATLVSGAKGCERNVVEMKLMVPVGVQVNDAPVGIVYMIN